MPSPYLHRITLVAAATLCVIAATPAFAGRPLVVDDANINDAGNGHIEVWYARLPGSTNVWTIAPAYAPVDGIELAAALARDTTDKLNTSSVQAKFRLTPSRKDGCNFAATLGLSHANDGAGNVPYVNGALTYNHGESAFDLNLGAIRPDSGSTMRTWGIAWEHEFAEVTGHVEYFGQQQAKPTLQWGLRANVLKNLQLDGTVGRTDHDTVFSLGLKIMFQ